MAYEVRYRERTITFKESGHPFVQLKEILGITSKTYYEGNAQKKATGSLAPSSSTTRKAKKISLSALKQVVAEHPDWYLKAFADHVACSKTAIGKRL